MLRELHISNLAVIADARLEFTPGLNVFTGQTGAGKSLILGAFEVLLGRRGQGDLLRAGAGEGRVTGVFELDGSAGVSATAHIARIANLNAEEISAGEPLIITRRLMASGRSSATVSGHPITVAMLREIGEVLVDLHISSVEGNASPSAAGVTSSPSSASSVLGEGQFLLRPANQLAALDALASGHDHLRAMYADLYRQWQDARKRLADTSAGEQLHSEQLELYQFQAAEIDSVGPCEGEYDELKARFTLLTDMEKISRQAGAVYASLYEGEGSAVERLQFTLGVLRDLLETDRELTEIVEIVEIVETATATAQDAAFALSRYLSHIEFDANELAEVTDRLNALNRLIAKYGRGLHGTLDDVLACRAELDERMAQVSGSHAERDQLEGQVAQLESQLFDLAGQLHLSRMQAAEQLAPLIDAELADLAMAEAHFSVAFDQLATPGPIGMDAIEMMIQPNPGQPPRPLRRTASGGELSRIMLALKTVVARSVRISVLVFDEIDAKIGGRLGTVIGCKLVNLSRRHQVLCITHLPQIAAFADRHLKITKSTENGQTTTTVSVLDADSKRTQELADMLAGKSATATTMKQAEELLALARRDSENVPQVNIVKRHAPAKKKEPRTK